MVLYDLGAIRAELNRQNRSAYVKRYAIKMLIDGYLAVSEMKTMDGNACAAKLYGVTTESILGDNELEQEFRYEAIQEYFKSWDELTPQANGKSVKELKNVWRRVGDWRRQIRLWNADAPSTDEVPSGETDEFVWRHRELRQRLWCKQTSKKETDVFERSTFDETWEPAVVWAAYEHLKLMDNVKFAAAPPGIIDPTDPNAATARRQTVSRAQQRKIDRRATKASNAGKRGNQDNITGSDASAFAKRLKVATLKSVHDGLIMRLRYTKNEAKINEIEKKLDFISQDMIAAVSDTGTAESPVTVDEGGDEDTNSDDNSDIV